MDFVGGHCKDEFSFPLFSNVLDVLCTYRACILASCLNDNVLGGENDFHPPLIWDLKFPLPREPQACKREREWTRTLHSFDHISISHQTQDH